MQQLLLLVVPRCGWQAGGGNILGHVRGNDTSHGSLLKRLQSCASECLGMLLPMQRLHSWRLAGTTPTLAAASTTVPLRPLLLALQLLKVAQDPWL